MKNPGKVKINPSLIAPCGMNCALCLGFQREKNTCPGCRFGAKADSASCRRCVIKNCDTIQNNMSGFCFECEKFPCTRLKNLDTRYRTKYSMSMLENLDAIKTKGMDAFLEGQVQKWTCEKCGALLCVHRVVCFKCGAPVSK